MTISNSGNFKYKFSDRFNQVCQPLFDKSPITFCSIARVFNDGTYTGFMSDPAWTDLYMDKHYEPTLSIWAENKIKLANIGHSIWSLSDFFDINKDTKNLLNDCNLFHYNNGINIIDQFPDYYEIATFASAKLEGVESFFIHHQDILRNYILYIKEKIFSDSKLANEFDSHYSLPVVTDFNKLSQEIKIYDVNVKKYYVGFPLMDNDYLTQREMDCLLPYILGVPKKVVATHLKISIRTIETHLENIKNKCLINDLSCLRLLFAKNKYVSSRLTEVLHFYL